MNNFACVFVHVFKSVVYVMCTNYFAEKWISDWSMTHPLQSLQEWQKKAFGSPITSPPCNYQEQSSPYDAKCWSSDEYQMQFFKGEGSLFK